MYYLIEETLKEIGFEEVKKASAQYVAVLTFDEWEENKDSFDMGIDIEPDFRDIHTTKAEVNFDSLTGSFFIPNRSDISDKSDKPELFMHILNCICKWLCMIRQLQSCQPV